MSVYNTIVEVLGESLAVDPQQVTPGSNLLTDLGAESIDLLDIVFHLEHEFGIRIERGELFPDFLFRSAGDLIENGRLTETGRKQVAEAFPFLEAGAVANVAEPRDLFTVGLVAAYVEWKVAQHGDGPTRSDAEDCGA